MFVDTLVRQKEAMFVQPPTKIWWCYSILQPFMTELVKDDPSVELHQGFDPDIYKNHTSETHGMIILDDLMSDETIYKHLSDLFTKYSRHLGLSCVQITQNPYFKGTSSAVRYNRDILSNATELVIFRNLRDSVLSLTLGKQAFPSRYKFYVSVLKDAHSGGAHSYLYLSFHPENRDDLILRSHIFYMLETPVIYLEKT